MNNDLNLVILEVDSSPTILGDFIEVNTASDVVPLTDNEIDLVNRLQPGESVYIGTSEVKRIL